MKTDITTQSNTIDSNIFTNIKDDIIDDYNIIKDDILDAELDISDLIKNETDDIINEINNIDQEFKLGI